MSVAAPSARRPPPWRNVRILRFAFQAVFLFLVAILLLFLWETATDNLRRLGIRTDFRYLRQSAGFAIPDSDFRSSQSLFDALLVGMQNTAKVSLIGIVLATILGVVVGVARLSSNWLVRRAAAAYVEAFRNVPVLIIIFFLWLGIFLQLPPISRATEVLDLVVISNRGMVVPWFDKVGSGAAFFATGRPWVLATPERGEFSTAGGFRLSPEYAALLLGLTIYTASHIAEIVRGSILAVPRGQSEAANAVGLSGFQRLRHVVMPQAFRICIPPVANQYLNLVKNSSLGVAVSYYEVTKITQVSISQAAPAVQAILVLMGIYLVFSLSIALVTNVINRRLTLKGR